METGSIITIIAVLVIIYLLIKFIISPLIKIITGIVVILIALYILNRFFSFSFNQIIGPFSNYINIDGWIKVVGGFVESWINTITKIFSFLNFVNKK